MNSIRQLWISVQDSHHLRLWYASVSFPAQVRYPTVFSTQKYVIVICPLDILPNVSWQFSHMLHFIFVYLYRYTRTSQQIPTKTTAQRQNQSDLFFGPRIEVCTGGRTMCMRIFAPKIISFFRRFIAISTYIHTTAVPICRVPSRNNGASWAT